MSRVRIPLHLMGLVLLSGLSLRCAARAEPLIPAGTPALDVPEPPVRVVVPWSAQPTLPPPVEEDPPSATTSVAKPPVRNPNPRPVPPPPGDPPVTVTPRPAPAILLTSANSPAFEKQVRDRLALATTHLAQVSRPNLGTDAKAQYDAAQGFIRQAEEALKVKNLIYAGQLADKAATMAALLRK